MLPDRAGQRGLPLAAWLAATTACWLTPSAAPAAQKPADKRLTKYPTRYYIIHTDLDANAVREAAARMTAMAEEYHRRTRSFAGVIRERMPFYLYSSKDDYYEAGATKGSAGIFDGSRLMAMASEGLTDRLWHVVQHEGFHQFAHMVIGGQLPPWIDEGMAEYFAQGIWTGDDFVTGVIPPYRLKAVQSYISNENLVPFLEMVSITPEKWSQALEEAASEKEKREKEQEKAAEGAGDATAHGGQEDAPKSKPEPSRVRVQYDQAWSMVHFLVHAENGKYREPFGAMIRDISRRADWKLSFQHRFGRNLKTFEKRYSDWWLAQPPEATQDLYVQAIVQTLTSFLARAASQGQKFQDAEDFFSQARAGELKCDKAQWLPPKLLDDSLLYARKWQRVWSLQTTGRCPALVLTWPDGKVYTGAYTCSAGKAANIKVTITQKKDKPEKKP